MTSLFYDFSQVNDHLFISSARAVTVTNLQKNRITYVVNVTREIPILHIKDIQFYKIPIDDSLSANLYPYFDIVADNIFEEYKKGGKILVHCIAGASRSATLCIVYLMKYQKMSLKEAFHFLKSHRPVVRPNTNFFNQLVKYEEKLFGRTSVKMVEVQSLGQDCLIPDVYKEECKGYVWLASIKNYLSGKK
ncbi:dual specificity protein phosphatase 21-like isoform X1 [Centruroides vittatus]|uniref:dual specificity protein phosphatase 21-like isoform X1 n=1 Tax=Centruroides vittatus TaxID=120091 RepID=UPI00351008AE